MNRADLRSVRAVLALQWRAAPRATVLSSVASLVAGLLPASTAFATKLLLDELARGPRDHVVALAVVVALASGAMTTLGYLGTYLDHVIRHAISLAVHEALFGKVIRLPGLEPFEDPEFHDRLRLAERAATVAPQQIASLVAVILRTSVTMISLFGVVFWVSPWLAISLLGCGLAGIVGQWLRGRAELQLIEKLTLNERWRDWYRSLLVDVRAAKEIRLFGVGPLLLARMRATLVEGATSELAIERRTALVSSMLSLAMAGATVIGALIVATGSFALGDVVLFFAAVVAIDTAFTSLFMLVGMSGRVLAMFQSYEAVMALPAPADRPVVALPPLESAIALVNVWFRYHPTSPWILRGVDLTIRKGEVVGLVGANGAGKSTLVKLICGFYQPERGRITWDGVDLRELDPCAVRQRIGATFQDFMSYELSAEDNIAMAETGPDLADRIRAAAQQVELDTALAALPRGYQTLLSRVMAEDDGARGTSLSGGQWQRLALARSLIRDRVDLLVLDEPSSGLDVDAEYQIHQTLTRHGAGRASLLISHRLNALRTADTIAVLVDGSITELGSHEALMAQRSEYARLFTLQASGYQDARSM